MALSRRGRDALAYVDCEGTIVNSGIAMRARMIHDLDCSRHPIPYGTRPEHVSHDFRRNNHFKYFND